MIRLPSFTMLVLALAAAAARGAEPAVKLPPFQVTERALGDFAISHRHDAAPPRNQLFLVSLARSEFAPQAEHVTSLRIPGAKDGDEILLIEGRPVAMMTLAEWRAALIYAKDPVSLIVCGPGEKQPRAVTRTHHFPPTVRGPPPPVATPSPSPSENGAARKNAK
jgi:hypothetical protein